MNGDLVPWEPLFLVSMLGLLASVIVLLARALRRQPTRIMYVLPMLVFAFIGALPWLTVSDFGTRFRQGSQTNIADTRENAAALGLQPRRYDVPLSDVANEVAATLDSLGWRITSRDEQSFDVEVPVTGGVFTDDLRVTLTEEASADESQTVTVVHVVSRSRVGRGDLGENRRHIVQLLTALDQRIGANR